MIVWADAEDGLVVSSRGAHLARPTKARDYEGQGLRGKDCGAFTGGSQ
jgi:hypothetical protein